MPRSLQPPHALPEQNLTAQSWRPTSSRGFWLASWSWAQGLCKNAGRTGHSYLFLPPSALLCHSDPPPPRCPVRTLEHVLPSTLQLGAGQGWPFSPCFVGAGGGAPGGARHPSMSQLKRWCFTSMSWTPSFKGFFSSCTRQPSCHRAGHTVRKPGGRARVVLTGSASTQGPPEASATQKRLGEAAPGTDASLPQLPQSPGRQAPPPTSLFAGSSQSWERLNAKQQRTLEGEGGLSDAGRAQPPPGWACRSPGSPHRSSHLIWTQPGLRRKDQGWYHFSTVGRLEQSTSSHRCSTCSLGAGRAPAQQPAPPPLPRLRRHHHLPQPRWSLSQ